MQAYAKKYIKKIEEFLRNKNASAELILVGGVAMEFYGNPRYTLDIDAEIKCENTLYFELVKYLKNEGISFNLSENISGWSIIPLPEGYRTRTKTVYESKNLNIKVLDPVDFIFSKLLRGTDEDFKDILFVIKKYKISKNDILQREKMVKYPKDSETLFFKKKLEHLISLIEK